MATTEGAREAASGKGRVTGVVLGDSFVCSFKNIYWMAIFIPYTLLGALVYEKQVTKS